MIKFVGRFKIRKFDNRSFTKEMQEKSKRLMRKAAIAFLNAATERIPRRTEFARGGFDNLATALGVKGKEGPRNTTPRKNGEYYYLSAKRRIKKSREAGRRFSTQANIERIIQNNFPTTAVGKVAAFVTKRKPSFVFEYSTSINYIGVNEKKWKALQAGLEAFRLVLESEALSVIPKVKDFVTEQVITVK